MSKPDRVQFFDAFRQKAARVRTHLIVSAALGGLALGLVGGAAAAVLLWWQRLGDKRLYALLLGLAGAIIGVLVARRQRWTDTDVALYLDGKLDSDEAITTAVALEASVDDGAADREVYRTVVEHAKVAVAQKSPKGLWPRIVRPWHAVGALGIAGVVWINTWAVPAAAEEPTDPGSSEVMMTDTAEIDRLIELLDGITPCDEAQEARLATLKEEARALRTRLAEGVELREAQHEIAALRDALLAERLKPCGEDKREGEEAALEEMKAERELDKAARALGDRDMKRFDEEMERLENKLDAGEREKVKERLEKAAEEAKEGGAPNLAKTLEEAAKRLDDKGKDGDKLKKLAEALGEATPPDDPRNQDTKRALEQMKRDGSPEAKRELAKALEKQLDELGDGERQELKKQLEKKAQKEAEKQAEGGKPEADPAELKKLAEALDDPALQKQLAKELQKLATQKSEPSSAAKRQEQLAKAERELDDLQRRLAQKGDGQPGDPPPGGSAGQPGPLGSNGMPQPGPNASGRPGPGPTGSNGAPGPGGSGMPNQPGPAGSGGNNGPSRGGGPAPHGGSTAPVDTNPLELKTEGAINPDGTPNAGGEPVGVAKPKATDSANKAGVGALGAVGPGEVGAVDRSEIPREYREQVGRYFQ